MYEDAHLEDAYESLSEVAAYDDAYWDNLYAEEFDDDLDGEDDE